MTQVYIANQLSWSTSYYYYPYAANIFLEEPTSNYILIERSATFYCKTSVYQVYWFINGDHVSEHSWSTYNSQFHFDKEITNLSVTIIGTEQTNLTTIVCDAYSNDMLYESHQATLFVYDTFSKWLNFYIAWCSDLYAFYLL